MTSEILKMYNTQNKEIRKRNTQLNARLDKYIADMEYLAMMSDIELDEEEDEENVEE